MTRKMTFKEVLVFIGQMILGLIMAALLLAEWFAVGLFVYCWYFS